MLKHVSPYRSSAGYAVFRKSETLNLSRQDILSSVSLSAEDTASLGKEDIVSLSKADTVSLSSSTSFCSSGGSPEPVVSSRCSSFISLSDTTHTTPIKVYARCLRPDIEYKTLSVNYRTTCKELVATLLSKYRMKHRDPNLFYLTMEVDVRKRGVPVRTLMVLDEEARPAELQYCHPPGDSRFCLRMRRGGLVRIYDSVLNAGSQYKSLLISEWTTVDDLTRILLNCCSSKEPVDRFSLYEVCESRKYDRKLHPDDLPLQVQQMWPNLAHFHFVLRRNLDYNGTHVRKLLWSRSLDLPRTRFPSEGEILPKIIMSTGDHSSFQDYENYFYI